MMGFGGRIRAAWWLMFKRARLDEALWNSRRKTRARGHDWDVADVMAVLNG
jgi:hypothetical protein